MTRVLIVDDKAENLYLLRALLKGHGCEVDEARHGAEALVKARQAPPDLIISDLLMPVMDGYTLLRHWKADERLKQIPFVVYTATYTEPKDEKLALDLGADAFIIKPAEPEPFMARIREVLAKHGRGELAEPRKPTGDEKVHFKEYSEVLIRKLEEKALQLEQANRALQADITERKQAEGALRESEEKFSTAFRSSPLALVITTLDGKYVEANRAFCDLVGYSREEIIGKTVIESGLVSEQDREKLVAAIDSAGGSMSNVEIKFRVRDGSVRDVIYSVATISLHGVPHRQSTGLDITARKRAEAALQQSEQKYRRLHETMTDAFVLVDMAGHILECNRTYRDMLGYTETEIRQLTYLDVTPEKWHAFEARIVQGQILPQGFSGVYEKEYRRKDGTIFPVELRVSLVRDDAGQPAAMSAIVRDITERKQAEEALRESERKFTTLFHTNPAAIALTTPAEGRLLEVNDSYCRLFGHAREELIGRTVLELNFWVDPDERSKHVEMLGQGGMVPDFEARFRKRSGEIMHVLVAAQVINLAGEPVILGITRDITDRKRAEEALRELSGRLLRLQDEERRRLARELHDTVAQDLAALNIALTRLGRRGGELNESATPLLADCRALAQQSAQQVRTMSYLLHPPLLDELGLAGAVQDYAAGFASRSDIRVSVQIAEDWPRLPREMELALFRVVQESLANVHRHSGSPTATIRLRSANEALCVAVADAGRGLGDALSSASDKPLGVGVAGMRERLRQLGRRLVIESIAEGTTVKAVLPWPSRAT